MDYPKRLLKLQTLLSEHHCETLLIEDKTNLLYLTGQSLSAGVLVAAQQEVVLFVDSRYYENCKSQCPCQVLLSDTNPPLQHLASLPVKNVGFDSSNTSFQRYQEIKKLGKELLPLPSPLQALRMIKDPEELQRLRNAAQLGSKGYDHVRSLLEEGISEEQLATELEIFWLRQGSQGLAFDPIIAFGPNSSMPHYRAGGAILRKGMPVLIDIGVQAADYHSDMTRVVFFGEPPAQILEIFEIVREAQQAALNLCKPGILIGELDASARDLIASKGYGKCFGHSLGHGIGLEIHEAPLLRNKPPYQQVPLQAGMVITIEPGIYLPGIGGVRLEDTVAITEGGYENLTQRPLTCDCAHISLLG